MSAILADSSAALKTSPGASIADRVKAQLQRDYPPGALDWVDDMASWTGPVRVPVMQIDKTSGDTEWSAAAADKLKLQRFQKRVAAGWRKPVVLIRAPGSSRLFAVDGHTRILSCEALGQPVTAWVGTAKTATGPWRKVHSRQLANDDGAIELVGPKGFIHGWIFVGAPGVGGRVFHPGTGNGTVTGHDGGSVHVKFDYGGGTRTFQRGHSKGAGRLEEHAPAEAPKAVKVVPRAAVPAPKPALKPAPKPALKPVPSGAGKAAKAARAAPKWTSKPGATESGTKGADSHLNGDSFTKVMSSPKARAAYQKHMSDTRDALAARSGTSREEVMRVQSQWGTTSGDSHPETLGLHIAAAREFGIPGGETGLRSQLAPSLDKKVTTYLNKNVAKDQKILRAMYDSTQEQLRREGVSEVTLHRGMHLPGNVRNGNQQVALRPMSSFTSDEQQARAFAENTYGTAKVAKGTGRGMLMTTTVPASRILATGATGLGLANQAEYIMMGGAPVMAHVGTV
jgi:hypothetical protein